MQTTKQKFLLSLLVVLFYGCANQILYDEDESLAAPTTLSVNAVGGSTFQINYKVENKENTFIGYNLYISTSSISDSDIDNLVPFSLAGNIPSFRHDVSQLNSSFQKEIKTYQKKSNSFLLTMQFKQGQKYYFRICAYSRYGKASTPSKQVWAVLP